MKTLLVIDSYLSDQNKAEACLNLINQLKENFLGYEILLINKSKENYNLEKQVDYYFNYGKGFLVGYPPKELLESKKYERPYVYFKTDDFVFENWMPLTNVTDHVSGIYNTFILSCEIAKTLGYKKVFKVEYDTFFDKDEIKLIKNDVEDFQDYLFYGVRKEGEWAKDYQYLIDVHICGYSVDVFENFKIVKNDKEFWELCEKINYYGKWIEYIIPSVIEQTKKYKNIIGKEYNIELRKFLPKSKFDLLNSPGHWTEKWKDIPKIARISNDNGASEVPNQIMLFYYNNDYKDIKVNVEIKEGDIILHNESINMNHRSWYYFGWNVGSEITIKSTITENNKEVMSFTKTINQENIKDLNTRIVFK